MNKFYIYVLLCDDGSWYKGFTNNLGARYKQHLSGIGARHTKQHKPVKILYSEEFDNEQDAIKREKFLKSGSGREWLKLKMNEIQNDI